MVAVNRLRANGKADCFREATHGHLFEKQYPKYLPNITGCVRSSLRDVLPQHMGLCCSNRWGSVEPADGDVMGKHMVMLFPKRLVCFLQNDGYAFGEMMGVLWGKASAKRVGKTQASVMQT